MTNNDVLRRIRYIFDFNDAKMIAIFALADLDVRRGHIIAWLKKEDDPTFEVLKDHMLATFLNGLISDKRGKKHGASPTPERQITNNIVLAKLKIAMNLRTEDVVEITELGGLTLSTHELSSFMRRPGHRNYRECKDQVLRNFLRGLQIKFRDRQAAPLPENSPYANWKS